MEDNKKELVFNYFLEHPSASMIEISIETGVSKSSCQRYLNLPEYCNVYIPSTQRTIKEQLEYNKNLGNQKGGRATFQAHEVKRDETGKFIGVTKTEEKIDREEKKREDIIKIVNYFSKNPYSTLEEIANFFDGVYTKYYVYDCLNDTRVEEIFGKTIASQIRQQLSNNRYSISKTLATQIENDALNKIEAYQESQKNK